MKFFVHARCKMIISGFKKCDTEYNRWLLLPFIGYMTSKTFQVNELWLKNKKNFNLHLRTLCLEHGKVKIIETKKNEKSIVENYVYSVRTLKFNVRKYSHVMCVLYDGTNLVNRKASVLLTFSLLLICKFFFSSDEVRTPTFAPFITVIASLGLINKFEYT